MERTATEEKLIRFLLSLASEYMRNNLSGRANEILSLLAECGVASWEITEC